MNIIYQDYVGYRRVTAEELQDVLHRAVEMEIKVYASLRSHGATLTFSNKALPAAPCQRNAVLVPLLPRYAQELRLFPDAEIKEYPAGEGGSYVLPQPRLVPREQIYIRVEDAEGVSDPCVREEARALLTEFQTLIDTSLMPGALRTTGKADAWVSRMDKVRTTARAFLAKGTPS